MPDLRYDSVPLRHRYLELLLREIKHKPTLICLAQRFEAESWDPEIVIEILVDRIVCRQLYVEQRFHCLPALDAQPRPSPWR